MATSTTRIAAAIEAGGVLLLPGCHDALSARLLARAGFEAGFISGYAVSATLLGKPDVGLLTPPEMAAAARRICEAAGDIPIIADADTGGGNVLNVRRTVSDLIAAGAAGCILEDQQWPKKCGHMQGKRVIPMAEHCQKILAAREVVKKNDDFVIIGRTDARAVHGLDEALRRANAYVEAGADGSFVEAPRSEDELRIIGQETAGFRVANMVEGGATPLLTPAELEALGFHLVLHPVAPLYASARAQSDIYRHLATCGTSRDVLDRLATFAELNAMIDLDSIYELEHKYRPAHEEATVKRRLIIMRHAKSAWDTGASTDHDRPLNKRGRNDAPRVAAKIAELGWSPELTVSSDSKRTRQTYKRMRDAFEGEVQVRFTRSLYQAGLGAVQDELSDLSADVTTVMVLGHNPGWEDMLRKLCGHDLRLTTANAALLTIEAGSWAQAVSRDTWTLEHLLRPKEL